MSAYVVRRLAWAALLLALVSLLAFVVFYVVPATDPAQLRAGRNPNPELVESIRRSYGLDRSLPGQYLHFVGRAVLHGDLGYSYTYDETVAALIFDRLPATIYLTLGAVVLWMLVAIPVGVVSALRRHSIFDRVSMGLALLAISAPVYWLGLVCLYLFANDGGKLPIFLGVGEYAPPGQDLGRFLGSLVMPWAVLAASFAAFYARLLRSNVLEVMSEDYVRTARAKGLRERAVVGRHVLRGAMTPLITVLGLDVGVLLGGAVLTESVFNIPGVGRLSYDAIQRGDLPVIQGTVLLGALFIVLLNLLVDIGYRYLDPRVRYS